MDRKLPPEARNIQKINQSYSRDAMNRVSALDNGIKVYIINAGEQEVVKIEFIFKAGVSSLQIVSSRNVGMKQLITSPLIPKLTLEMLTEGTETYSSEEIAELLDYYSAFIDKDCERDKAVLTVTCLNKHLENILPVLKEMILFPTFPASNFQLLTSIKRQHFILNNEKVSYVAKQQFKKLLFGDSHPYGAISKLDDFDKVEREMLKEFHTINYQLSNIKYIIISGKPDKNIISLLNKYFGIGSTKGTSSLKDELLKPEPKTRKPEHVFIEKKEAIQSAVRIGKVMSATGNQKSAISIVNYTHPDYYSFKILNTILGGYFGSRLMSNIREDNGYTYGINSNLISLYNSSYFFITSQIGVEHVNIAISEIYKEIKRLQNEKVPNMELELVRNYMQGNLLRSMDGPFAIAEMCRILIEYNLDEDYFDRYIEKIQTITSEEIMETAQKYLQQETMTELIVGGK